MNYVKLKTDVNVYDIQGIDQLENPWTLTAISDSYQVRSLGVDKVTETWIYNV